MNDSDFFLPMDALGSLHSDAALKRGIRSISENLVENLNDLSDDQLLKQINDIADFFEQERSVMALDTTKSIHILPVLVEQIQKNRSLEVNVQVVLDLNLLMG